MPEDVPPRGPALTGAWRRRRLQERAAFAGQDSYPGFALEYEIVPGVPADSSPRGIWGYLVGISYDADVPLPWEPCDGGAVAPAEGGASTHGSRGDWPLPPDARVLTFTLYAVGDDGFPCEDGAGDLVVDLSAPTAEWRPAAPVP